MAGVMGKEKTTCYSYFSICSEGEIQNMVGFIPAENSNFDPDYITELLGVAPFNKWRTGEPRKHGNSFYSTSNWSGCRQDTPALEAYEQFHAIVRMLKDKIPELNQIKQEYNVSFSINIVPDVYSDEITPALHFDEEIIKFCYLTGTVIDIDLYVN